MDQTPERACGRRLVLVGRDQSNTPRPEPGNADAYSSRREDVWVQYDRSCSFCQHRAVMGLYRSAAFALSPNVIRLPAELRMRFPDRESARGGSCRLLSHAELGRTIASALCARGGSGEWTQTTRIKQEVRCGGQAPMSRWK